MQLTLEYSCAAAASFDPRSFSIREGLNELFTVDLEVLSPEADIELESIIGQPASFTVTFDGLSGTAPNARSWSGIASHAQQLRALEPGPDGHAPVSRYGFRIVPRLWLMSLRSNYRLFQGLTVPEIIQRLLEQWAIKPAWRVDPERYPKLELKTQYGESDYDLFRRLLQDAGISFACTCDQGEEILVLSDNLARQPHRTHAAIPYVDQMEVQAVDVAKEIATSLRLQHDVRSGGVHHRDFDFRNPAEALTVERAAGSAEKMLESYRYRPGAFLAELEQAGEMTPTADDRGAYRRQTTYGKHLAELDMDSLRTGKRRISFETNAIDLAPGCGFSLLDHPHPSVSEPLVVVGVTAAGTMFENCEIAVDATFQADPLRPPMVTSKPTISSLQSAIVVGPDGEEIHTDEYGRVRVQFPWDREGKTNEESSCWMRVLQGWAGPRYGMVTIPRIGQEVMVSFLGGDPDAPVVVGRVYNELNPVPYALPENKTVSGWKSCSTPMTGGYNEIKLEDKANKELVYIRAQRDYHKLVQRDWTERIGRHHHRTVEQDQHLIVQQSKRELVQQDDHALVQGSRFQSVQGSLSVRVAGARDEVTGATHAVEAGEEVHVKAPNIVIEAGNMTIKGDGGFITLGAGGVDIVGAVVNINSGGSALSGAGSQPTEPEKAEEALPKDDSKQIED